MDLDLVFIYFLILTEILLTKQLINMLNHYKKKKPVKGESIMQ